MLGMRIIWAVPVIASILILVPLVAQEAMAFTNTWHGQTPDTSPLAVSKLFSISCPTPNACVAVGSIGITETTSNGGEPVTPGLSGTPWTQGSSGLSNVVFSIFCPTTNTCYAVGNSIKKTINAFTAFPTWSIQDSGTANFLTEVFCTDDNTCYAVGFTGTIQKTTNGGATTWSTQTPGTNNNLNSISCPAANTCYAVGASGTIQKTANGGATWNTQTSGTTNNLRSIYLLCGR